MASAKILILSAYILSANRLIRVISEVSRDTENWSNDAENLALPSQRETTF